MSEYQSGDRIAGAALMSAAGAIVLVMAHHPTSAHAGAIGGLVHGAMIVLISLLAFGFARFAIRRGLVRPAVLAGLVAYGIALFGHVGAATINGFVVPALAARHVASHDIFLFAWQANQALAALGVYAGSVAYLLWSLDFLGRRGTEPRLIGLAGLAAGLVPAILLGFGGLVLDVAGAMVVYAIQSGWAAVVGIHLVNGGLEKAA